MGASLKAAGVAALAVLLGAPRALADESIAYRGPVVLDNGVPTQADVAVTASTPLPAGAMGAYNATRPTLGNGQRTDVQLDTRGNLGTAIYDANGNQGAAVDPAPANGSGMAGALRTSAVLRLFNGSTYDVWTAGNALGAGGGSQGVAAVLAAPTSSQGQGIAPVSSTAAEASHVIKGAAGNLYRIAVTTGGSAGYLLVFDAVSAPADGAVAPKVCRAIAANTSVDIAYDYPERYATGITAVFSSTGCFSKTASATAHIEALAL